MPAKYEAIKRDFIVKGLGTKEAKTRAAKIYNATRKPGQRPVTGRHERKDRDD